MFEWLEQEMSAIKTPRFHIVDGPADQKLRSAVNQSSLLPDSSYKEFVLKFGNAKLYRNSRNNSYYLGVFAGPREATEVSGNLIYHIGFHDGASVYVKPAAGLNTLPIFESESGLEEKVADNFEEWLKTSCARKRETYSEKEWANILRGPKPFSTAEKLVIDARRNMHWKTLGVDASGRHIFEITNNSRSVLPALTLGVRSKDGRLNGAIRLDIQHILSGQTSTLHADCYKDLVPPENIEIFDLPDPQPEDRERFWEFGN